MAVEKPKSKQLPRPITTGANSAMNQSQLLTIICNLLKAREKLRVHGAIGFCFASHWLKNWREAFKPITKRSNRSHVITLDSHFKTALIAGKATTLDQGSCIFAMISGCLSSCRVALFVKRLVVYIFGLV